MASGQTGETATLDVITLKMPIGLATQLQRRIAEGGDAAASAIDRLPDLAKNKKLEELDRWHVDSVGSEACKRTISGGRDLTRSNGEIVPVGIAMEIEPALLPGRADVRLAIEHSGPIRENRKYYSCRQNVTATTIQRGDWTTLASWRDDEQTVLILGKLGRPEDSQKNDSAGLALQSSLAYSLCEIGSSASASRKPASGAAADELLKTAKIVETGSIMLRQNREWTTSSLIYPMDVELADEESAGFSLSGCVLISADQKQAEAGIIAEWNPKHQRGKHAGVSLNEWLSLPVGTLTMIPLNDDDGRGPGNLWLALELTTKELSPHRDLRGGAIVVPPSARRLLAEAAGLPVPKPGINKGGFEALPKLEDSLTKLGLKLPLGVRIFLRDDSSIWLTGKDAPHAQLKEILAKHLPLAAE